jgi:uncharacterized membrane protein YdjX (TVP38/TMEM64 family)
VTRDQKRILLGALLACLALGLVVLAVYRAGLFQFFMSPDELLAFVRRHRGYAALTLIALQVTQVVAGFIPGEVTGFAGGALFGPLWGTVYSTVGLTLGSWIAFLLARHVGRPLVNRLFKRQAMARYEAILFGSKRRLLALLMFLIPGFPKDVLCYLLGFTAMGHVEFLLISTAGRLLGTTFLAFGGAYFREEKYVSFFILAGIALGTALLVWIFKEQIERWMRQW